MNNDEFLNKIVTLMQNDTSADAPESAVKWAKNLFRTRAAQPKESFVSKIVAVLQRELSPGTAAFGERSGGATTERQLLFSAGDAAVDLRIVSEGRAFRVNGQILGEGFNGASVTLKGEAFEMTAELGELGEFSFTGVKSGNFSVVVKNLGKEIEIESIKIG